MNPTAQVFEKLPVSDIDKNFGVLHRAVRLALRSTLARSARSLCKTVRRWFMKYFEKLNQKKKGCLQSALAAFLLWQKADNSFATKPDIST